MLRIRSIVAAAVIGAAVVACQSAGSTSAPSLAPVSPAASAPAGSPAASAPASVAPSPSPTASAAVLTPAPAMTPQGNPGETVEIPFEPAGSPELGGTVTLTEYGSTTHVVVAFTSFQVPATGAVALLKVGTCETPEISSNGSLAVVDGRLEGTIGIPLDIVLDLPHAVVLLPSAGSTDPIVCIDTPRPS